MRVTIKAKLAFAFGLITILMGVSGFFALSSLSSSNQNMQNFAARPFSQVQRVGLLESRAIDSGRVIARVLLVRSDAERQKLRSDFQANDVTFRATLAEYSSHASAEYRGQAQVIGKAWDEFMEASNRCLDLALKNGRVHAEELVNRGAEHAEALSTALRSIGDKPGISDQVRVAADSAFLALTSARRDLFKMNAGGDDAIIKRMGDDFGLQIGRVKEGVGALMRSAREGGFQSDADAVSAALALYEPLVRRAVEIDLANDEEHALKIYFEQVTQGRAAVLAGAVKLREHEASVAAVFVKDAADSYESTRTMMITIVLCAVILAVSMAVWMAVSISKGLSRAVDVARNVADGDLTQEIVVSGRDEITDLTRAMKGMSDKLKEVVGQVTNAAQNVSAGSTELSASAEQLSEGSNEQAASTEEASASVEEMAANIKQNADNATQTERIAGQSATDAEASGVAVSRAVDAMQTIASKITIVQEIARQTDLLALNAAVEAARAGEHGKGFAVVASEVRKLAERSQAAAAEIGTLSSETLKVAQEAGSMLGRLVPDIKRTATLVQEISSACREQDVGADQINQAIQQLDKVTQQNAASSEEVSATSEELASQAEQLQAIIGFFRTGAHAEPPIARTVKQLRANATAAVAAKHHVRRTPRAAPVRAASVQSTAAAGQGFAFDMGHDLGRGADDKDAEFQRA